MTSLQITQFASWLNASWFLSEFPDRYNRTFDNKPTRRQSTCGLVNRGGSTLQQQNLKNHENITLYLYINPNPIPMHIYYDSYNTNCAINVTAAVQVGFSRFTNQIFWPVKIRTIQRVKSVRVWVRVMVLFRVLSAFTSLRIVRSANPHSALYPWPVVERYDRYTNCSCTHLLIRHS